MLESSVIVNPDAFLVERETAKVAVKVSICLNLEGCCNLNDLVKAGLTKSQARVGELLLHGLANREIAIRLGITRSAVQGHITAMCLKCEPDIVFGLASGRGKRVLLARKLMGA